MYPKVDTLSIVLMVDLVKIWKYKIKIDKKKLVQELKLKKK